MRGSTIFLLLRNNERKDPARPHQPPGTGRSLARVTYANSAGFGAGWLAYALPDHPTHETAPAGTAITTEGLTNEEVTGFPWLLSSLTRARPSRPAYDTPTSSTPRTSP